MSSEKPFWLWKKRNFGFITLKFREILAQVYLESSVKGKLVLLIHLGVYERTIELYYKKILYSGVNTFIGCGTSSLQLHI